MSKNDSKKEDQDPDVIIRIIGLEEDEKLDYFSKLIGNKTSRKFLDILIKTVQGIYKGGVAALMPVTYSVMSYHWNNAEELGLLIESFRKIRKKGIKHKHAKIQKQLIIIPFGFDKEELQKPGVLKKLVSKAKFVAVALSSLLIYSQTAITKNSSSDEFDFGNVLDIPFYNEPTFLPMLIIIVFLVGERCFRFFKKNMRLVISDLNLL